MSEPSSRPPPARPITPVKTTLEKKAEDPALCDRRSAAVYRMQAVGRCPACGVQARLLRVVI